VATAAAVLLVWCANPALQASGCIPKYMTAKKIFKKRERPYPEGRRTWSVDAVPVWIIKKLATPAAYCHDVNKTTPSSSWWINKSSSRNHDVCVNVEMFVLVPRAPFVSAHNARDS
jgi:hypothetical protein